MTVTTTTIVNGHVSPKITLAETNVAMQALIVPGLSPNGKVAYWNACLSIRNGLERNCKQASIMRTYANKPLPLDRSELNKQLGGVMPRTLNTIYAIESLWNAGTIHFNCGSTFQSQFNWRLQMCAAIPGMSMKTVSFALHIFNPFGCLLLTIDTHHCYHLNFNPDKLKPVNYIELEKKLYSKCADLACEDDRAYMPIVYAACLWERTRKERGYSKENEYQDHSGLTCYC